MSGQGQGQVPPVAAAAAAAAAAPAMAWPVDRYCRREGSSWVPVDDGSGSFMLHSRVGHLMLIQNGTVLESLPLGDHTQMHAIVKGDTLLIAARHQISARKFKVRFQTIQAAKDCVAFLQDYFPIKDISRPTEPVHVPLTQLFQQLMLSSPMNCLPNPDPLPASFPLEETLHMCILDPSFPALVARVGVIMNSFNN